MLAAGLPRARYRGLLGLCAATCLFLLVLSASRWRRDPSRLRLPPAPSSPSLALRREDAVLLAAAGMRHEDLAVTLLSFAEVAPAALVVLLIEPSDEQWLAALLAARAPHVRARAFSWPALASRLPRVSAAALYPNALRMLLYPFVLDELEAEAAATREGSSGDGKSEASPFIIFTSAAWWAAPPISLPTALLLCDARDVVFQAEPFAGFRRAFEPELRAGAGVSTALLLVAAELDEPDNSTKLGRDDWNRGCVHACYGGVGEALLNDKVVHCSGTVFATPAGLRALSTAMAAGYSACLDIAFDAGIDQAVFNALTHAQEPALLADLRAREPRTAALLDAQRQLQAAVVIRAARTEDGHVCTLALAIARGRLQRDALGRVTAVGNHSRPCAVVHQYDRDPLLSDDVHAQHREDAGSLALAVLAGAVLAPLALSAWALSAARTSVGAGLARRAGGHASGS